MSQRYTIEKIDSVIRVHTSGGYDFVSIFEMWEQIIAACESHNCFRVIGLSNLDEPPAQVESYEYLSMLQAVGLTPKYRVAWVAENPALLDVMMLAETVIKHRSALVVRVFADVDGAESWMHSAD